MMNTRAPARASRPKLAIAAALLAAVSLGAADAPAHAVSVADRIRVALFLDLGSKYQALTPVATLSSAGGLKLSWAGAPIAAIDEGKTVRFAVDGYRALVIETDNPIAAASVLKKVQQSSNAALMIKLNKYGKAVYQVTEGNYATAAAASAAVAKWKSAGDIVGVKSLVEPAVAGPWAVEAGPYDSAEAASDAAARFGAAGLDAFVAIKTDAGSAAYYVRVGQAADAAALPALKTKAAASGQSVQIPAQGGAYAVIRNDMTAGGASGSAVPLYALSASAGAKLLASPAGNAGIQLAERSKRTYRGNMELSVLNGDLAVINDVPLEQYLYAVVGSEVPGSWPLEAQKAQAVAARSYALSSGVGFQIANVVDTTLSQTYNGIGGENKASIAGVDATAGEVLTYNGQIINAVFSSNAGGVTADNKSEIWLNDAPYLAGGVQSPDAGPQEGKLDWYKVVLPDSGEVGYVRSDYLADSGTKNAAGIELYASTGDGVSVRPSPQTIGAGATPIGQLYRGDQVVVLAKVPEYTNYSWIEGPFKASEMETALNNRAKTKISGLKTLEVAGVGPSGRVTAVKANGQTVDVGVPDNLRGALGGLKSTLFDLEETGRFTVIGADGQKREVEGDGSSLQVMGANGTAKTAGSGNLLVMDGGGKLRSVTTDAEFVFTGKGYGHGLGLSQWGAEGLAAQGFDYQYILQYYYKNVKIEKDGGE